MGKVFSSFQLRQIKPILALVQLYPGSVDPRNSVLARLLRIWHMQASP